jgi:hypothetical protein
VPSVTSFVLARCYIPPQEEALGDRFDSPRVGPGIKRAIHAEKRHDRARHIACCRSFCFAQGTTEKKTEVEQVIIKQTSASSSKETDSVVQQRISNIVTYIETLQESKARGLAGFGRQEEEPFLSAVSFCGHSRGARVGAYSKVKSRGRNPVVRRDRK